MQITNPKSITQNLGDGLFKVKNAKSKNFSFQFRYSLKGTRKTHTLGVEKSETNTAGISEALAKIRLAECKNALKNGETLPIYKAKPVVTLQIAFNEMMEIKANLHRENTKIALTNAFKGVEKYKNLPVTEFTTPLITNLIKEKAKNQPATARMIIFLLNSIFDQLVADGTLKENPVKYNGKNILKNAPRDRFLTDEELKILFDLIIQDTAENIALKLLLATALRKMSLLSLKWKYINFDARTITIPKEISKNKEEAIFPLSDYTLILLKKLKNLNLSSELLFPKLNESSLNNYIKKFYKHFDKTFTIHDLRRTTRTKMSELNIDAVTAENCLQHKLPELLETYDKSDPVPKMKVAFNAVGKFYQNIENPFAKFLTNE